MSRRHIHRRTFLEGLLAGSALTAAFPGIGLAAGDAASNSLRKSDRRVLFIWLAGGASQFETWDPKPFRETGGPFRPIPTSVPGTEICELLPKMAARMQHVAIVRSLNTTITAHEIAADVMHVGRTNEPALVYPEIGTVLAKELSTEASTLPDYVSLFLSSEGHRRPDPGYLGGRYAPLHLRSSMRPENIDLPAGLTDRQHADREELRALLTSRFQQRRGAADIVNGYNSAYQKVRGLMQADHLFDIEREPDDVRARYGKTVFGQHCLLARRLLEAGVPVVKVARGFWDSHHDNFESHRELVTDFDNVFSALLDDLHERGLLESTEIVVLSEFGRTPKINKDVGRDHYAAAWSCLFAGCGIKAGACYGKTDRDGVSVVDGEATAGDVAATIFQAVGIDPQKHYYVGPRPVPLSPENSQPISGILG